MASKYLFKNLGDIFKTQKQHFEPPTPQSHEGNYRAFNYTPKSEHLKNIESFSFTELMNDWTKIVGGPLAKVTMPVRIKDRILYIAVKHQAFANELKNLELPLMQKIKKDFPILGYIQTLKFFFSEKNFIENEQQEIAKINQDNLQARRLHPQSPNYLAQKKIIDQQVGNELDNETKDLLISLSLQISNQ